MRDTGRVLALIGSGETNLTMVQCTRRQPGTGTLPRVAVSLAATRQRRKYASDREGTRAGHRVAGRG
jgi:hypothetical protein